MIDARWTKSIDTCTQYGGASDGAEPQREVQREASRPSRRERADAEPPDGARTRGMVTRRTSAFHSQRSVLTPGARLAEVRGVAVSTPCRADHSRVWRGSFTSSSRNRPSASTIVMPMMPQ